MSNDIVVLLEKNEECGGSIDESGNDKRNSNRRGEQTGNWTMDIQFNRKNLIRRIQNIAARKKDIKLYNKDINSFITHYIS